ncbi:MAG: type II toxin-antitoxin system HigB family toxin [Sulfurimonas sp.]|uniref:type II toxin-antitoxin system HigB family toxin n=1 Tax=Sulfurimonas sp. TaxID=2022749 RepID=UPI00263507E9|nr:type II toxin-antitoxin system HigB family toxin [Sulfurimonas sp.]MDD5372854.1 type II toxin-antitoxin system HigB family toxin [Sulfurimonas sp.]
MRVISKRTLQDFWNNYPDAINPFAGWYAEAIKASWQSTHDIKSQYKTASFLRDNRVVFNIGGNKYRLIVKINYPYSTVYVRFVGTHAQYDKINAQEI